MIDYIDNCVGMGVPSVTWESYEAMTDLMQEPGLAISSKKLVPPEMQVTYLGILINTLKVLLPFPQKNLQT